LSRVPVSTPGGTFTFTLARLATFPEPPHSGHLSTITVPSPSQAGQVRETAKKPCEKRCVPLPPQTRQVWGLDPGRAPLPLQVSQRRGRGYSTSSSVPKAASFSVILRSTRRSAPRGRAAARRRAPPPKISEKMSPKMSPKPPKPSKSNPPKPSPKGLPACPKRSYLARFSGSERQAYASEASLNFSSASLSPGLRSGWYSRASFRYALLI